MNKNVSRSMIVVSTFQNKSTSFETRPCGPVPQDEDLIRKYQTQISNNRPQSLGPSRQSFIISTHQPEKLMRFSAHQIAPKSLSTFRFDVFQGCRTPGHRKLDFYYRSPGVPHTAFNNLHTPALPPHDAPCCRSNKSLIYAMRSPA